MADVERSLRNLLENIARENNYDNFEITVKPISSDGANYTTVLFLATITAPDKGNIELFAKVANLGHALRDKMNVDRLFRIENLFYSDILNKYKRLEDEHNIPNEHRLVTAKFYGSNMKKFEETIVLENLIAINYGVHDRFQSVNWKYASKAIGELTKLHALSFAYGMENPESFNQMLKNVEYDILNEESSERFKVVRRIMLNNALKATAEEKRDRLKSFMEPYLDSEIFKKCRQPLLKPTVIHGDYRHSNLMHRQLHDGSLEVVIIDYQTLQAGCPIMDLLYFIFNCSDEEFRRKHFDELVEHYYSQLCLALRRLHVDPEKAYPREDFDYELKEMLPFGLTIGLFTLQIVTVEAANAPKLDAGLAEFNVKTSDLFAERLNGIVNDYIRWGII